MPDTVIGRNEMAVTEHPPVATRLEVRPFDNLVLDTLRASLLRERDLERRLGPALQDAKFVVVDLNGIRSLDVLAAYELVGKFVAQLRLSWSTKGAAPVVAITADNLDILRTVHAALRDSRNAAYALLPERPDPVVPMGNLTKQDLVDLQRLREIGPTTGDGAVRPERLFQLWTRGLLARDESERFFTPSAADFASG